MASTSKTYGKYFMFSTAGAQSEGGKKRWEVLGEAGRGQITKKSQCFSVF